MLFITIIFAAIQLQASTLGLLDSGADPNHDVLSKHLKINKIEANGSYHFDDDHNGYVDDAEGWNFINQTEFPFNKELYGSFGEIFYRYYKVRERKALETWSPKEESWYKSIRKDKDFLDELKKFRSYIHGSHVVGIAMKRDHKRFGPLNFVNVKYLGKAEKGLAKEPEYSPLKKGSDLSRVRHLKKFITKYNNWQEGKLARAIDYVCQKADVVNGSWGKSWKGSLKVVAQWYKLEFDDEPKEELNEELARLFLSNLIVRTQNITKKYPHILFVFSAGNTKTSNDDFPHYPSDARGNNILAVGASWHNKRTNSSNFGKKNVDLFAPGFLISSTTPENKLIKTTGTSQAAPRVSHAALVIKNINKQLVASEIKKIILGTVDNSSEFISVSGGLLNMDRVIKAAQYTLKFSVSKAIELARKSVLPKSFKKGLNIPNIDDDPLPEAF